MHSSSSGGEYKVEYQPLGQASCGFKGSLGYSEVFSNGPPLNDGLWHRVQCVKTAKQIKLIVDQTATYSKSGNVGSIANTNPVVIGSYPGAEFFQGSLDLTPQAAPLRSREGRPVTSAAPAGRPVAATDDGANGAL